MLRNKFIWIATMAALATALIGASKALAPSGGYSWPSSESAEFKPSPASPGAPVSYSYFYRRSGFTGSIPIPCDFIPDEEILSSRFDFEHSVTLWWEYGTPAQVPLDSQSSVLANESHGAYDEVAISGAFTVPADASYGTHNLTFVMTENVVEHCGETITGTEVLEPVVSSYQIAVQADAYAATAMRKPSIRQAQQLPSTGSDLQYGFLVMLGAALTLVFAIGYGRRASRSRG